MLVFVNKLTGSFYFLFLAKDKVLRKDLSLATKLANICLAVKEALKATKTTGMKVITLLANVEAVALR